MIVPRRRCWFGLDIYPRFHPHIHPRIRLRIGSLCCLLAVVLAPGSRAQADGRTNGYFLRAAPGLGFAASRETGVSWSGAGFFGSFAVGRFFAKNLALHADSFGNILSSAHVQVSGRDAPNLSVSEFGIGGGLTYYFMPVNVYVSPSVGAGVANLEGTGAGSSSVGLAADFVAAKEWFISQDFGLGVGGQLQAFLLPDRSQLSSFALGVLMSLTWNPGGRPVLNADTYSISALDARASEPPSESPPREPPPPAPEHDSAAELLPQAAAQPSEPSSEPPPPPLPEAPAAPPPSAADAPPAVPTRTLVKRGIALDVPADWIEKPSSGLQEMLRARESQLQSASFASVTVEAVLFMGDAHAFAQQWLSAAPANSVFEHADLSFGSLSGTMLVRSRSDLPNMRVLQLVTADGGAGYVVSCIVDESRFASQRPTCERIVKSFRFTTVH